MKCLVQLARRLLLVVLAASIAGMPWMGIFSPARAQSRRVSIGSFNAPVDWRVDNLSISSETQASASDSLSAQQVVEGTSLGLSVVPKTPNFGFEIKSFLAQRNLALSTDAVRISSDRGELIARTVQSEQTSGASEKTIEFVLYGNVDGRDYAYDYQFVYSDQTHRLLRGSATTLRAEGYEVDYQTGEAFQVSSSMPVNNDTGSPSRSKSDLISESALVTSYPSVASSTPADIDCILKNLETCSTYIDLGLCALTFGGKCLSDFLRSILIDAFCGITTTCQPLPSFSLSAGPSFLTVRQGQSGSYSVQAAFTGGFASSISSFTVSNLPSGVSSSFSPGAITSNGGRVNLNITATPTAPTGSSILTISAIGGGKKKTTTANLMIDAGRGTIQVNAAVNGSPWSGSLVWTLTGIGIAGGTSVPRTVTDMPAGAYGLTFLFGGPSNAAFVGISQSSQVLTPGNTTTFTFNFVTPPAGPSNLGTAAISSSQVTLSWSDNSSNETDFRIERKRTASGFWSEIARVGINTRSYSDSGLSSNTAYYYRVRASNQAGYSGYSNESGVTTRR
jgi:Fibronectin type III domain